MLGVVVCLSLILSPCEKSSFGTRCRNWFPSDTLMANLRQHPRSLVLVRLFLPIPCCSPLRTHLILVGSKESTMTNVESSSWLRTSVVELSRFVRTSSTQSSITTFHHHLITTLVGSAITILPSCHHMLQALAFDHYASCLICHRMLLGFDGSAMSSSRDTYVVNSNPQRCAAQQ
jgi:hypothetical protein